ncbi:IclR family transcriptional regulator [Devosia sp. A449]
MEKGVEAVDRALTILRSLVDGNAPMTLHEISLSTGLYKSTILRILVSLERFDFVRRRTDNRYALGPACAQLARSYQKGFDLTVVLKDAVNRLAEASGETASYYVRDGEQRVCVVRQNSAHAIRHHVEEGDRLPLNKGAAGLAILAFEGEEGSRFEGIRTDGYVVSLGERDPDAAAVSAPLFGQAGTVIGAMSISGLRSRFTYESIDRHRQLLANMVQEVQRQIGGKAPTA